MQTAEKKRSIFGRFLRLLLWFCVIVLLLAGSLVGLLFAYEKEVKGAILTELNKHLKVKVKVKPENIDLTILSTFPDCALRFKQVLVLDALPESKRDTLLYAGDLRLKFNVKDIWNEHYQIHSISAQDGSLKLKILKDNSTNYEFWNSNDSTSSAGSTEFALDLIELKNFNCLYRNNAARFMSDVYIKTLSFSGKFGADSYVLQTKGDLKVKELLQNKTAFLRSKKVKLDLDLSVNGDEYLFKKANLKINDLDLALKGKMTYGEELAKTEVSVSAHDLQIASVLSLLPEQYGTMVKDYESSGQLYLDGKFVYNSKRNWKLESQFGINKAGITYRPNNAKADGVNLRGVFEYSPNQSLLRLDNIYLQLKGDEIKGNFSLTDFTDPHIRVTTSAKLDLNNLYEFWPIDTLEQVAGRLELDAAVAGRLEDLKKNTFSDEVNLQLAASVHSLELKFKSDEKLYRVQNCNLKAIEGQVEVSNLQLLRGKSDITVNGKLPNFFKYLTDSEAPLSIEGNLQANAIFLEDFMYAGNASSDNKQQEAIISDKVKLKLEASIAHFEFGKFRADDVKGDLEVKNQKALVNEMQLRCMQGNVTINAFADNSRGKLDVTLDADIQQINAQDLFSQMNNFGQATLKDENIRGIASASVEFTGVWSNALEVDEKSIDARCKLLIERGELKKFEPLMALSKYVDIKDLEDIKFSSLVSDITIKDRKISLPVTEIKNSALNVDVSGYHTFDNDIDYRIKLVINELLQSKRKKQKSEFALLEEEGDRKYKAFIRMYGNLDAPKYAFDKAGFKDNVKAGLKNEKSNVKRIFKEEFGFFKKDSLPAKPAPKAVFELEDDKPEAPKKPLELKKKTEDEDF